MRRGVSYALLLVVSAWILFPIYWIVRASLMPLGTSFHLPPQLLFLPTLANYREILTNTDFPSYLLNSFVVGITATALAVILAVPAAYALVRYRFTGRRTLSLVLLTSRMALPVTSLVAFFVQFNRLGLLDSRLGLTIAYLSFNLPLAIWLLIGFMEQLSVEIEYAAMIDGCSRFEAIRRITVPLIAPGMAVTATICLLFSLNEFLFAAVLTSFNAKTATVAVYGYLGQDRLDWELMTATSVLVMLPVLLLAFAVRRYLVSGLTLGALSE
jgi:multiple sugar transport system permease protein